MSKIIQKLFIQKKNSFKEKVSLSCKADFVSGNPLYFLGYSDIKRIEVYFLPFKIKSFIFTDFYNKIIIEFKSKIYYIILRYDK